MPPVKQAAPALEAVDFGSSDIYVAGAAFVEGNYALEFTIMRFAGFKNTTGPLRLGCMVDCYSLTDPSAPKTQQFYGFGTKADDLFAPNPVTGKGIVKIPGKTGAYTLADSTNWNFFRESLLNSGLPEGIWTDDISVLDGIWVHMKNVPEPETRKTFANNKRVGEGGADQQVKGSGFIAVVSEILDDGKPWEGTGGLNVVSNGGAKPAAPAKAATKVAPAPVAAKAPAAVKRAVPTVVAPPEPTAEEAVSDEVQAEALTAFEAIFKKYPSGVARTMLRANLSKVVPDPDTRTAIIEAYLNAPATDAALENLVADMGWTYDGNRVAPV